MNVLSLSPRWDIWTPYVINHSLLPLKTKTFYSVCLVFIEELPIFPLSAADSPFKVGALIESVFECFIGRVHLPKENLSSLSLVEASETSHCPRMNYAFPSRTKLYYFLKQEQHSAQAGSPHFLAHYLFLPFRSCSNWRGALPCLLYASAHLRSIQSKCGSGCLFFVFGFSVCSALKCLTRLKMRLYSVWLWYGVCRSLWLARKDVLPVLTFSQMRSHFTDENTSTVVCLDLTLFTTVRLDY